MDQHAGGMYYIACCNWLVDALLLCMAGSIGALACSSLIQCITCNCSSKLVNTLEYSLSVHVIVLHTTLMLSCLYSALIRLGCFLLLQLFLQLGDMFTSDCFLLWSHTCDLYPNPSLLVNHLPQLTDSLITIN